MHLANVNEEKLNVPTKFHDVMKQSRLYIMLWTVVLKNENC